MIRFSVDIFPITASDDPRCPRGWGPIFCCRVERRVDGGRLDPVCEEFGPTKLDAWLRAHDYVRYERDMLRGAGLGGA